MSTTDLLVERIRQMIATQGFDHNDRLPSEREMCTTLEVTRNQLRQALHRLESMGLIWRHVGRGTFVGARPVLNLEEVSYLCSQVTPAQVASVRLTIEPELARLAATNSTSKDREDLHRCADSCREAQDWRSYEASDNKFHFTIARSAKNKLFLHYFETLNVVRRSMFWGHPRTTLRPTCDYSSFQEHDLIIQAIVSQDADFASHCMSKHLRAVYSRILPSLQTSVSAAAKDKETP